MRNPKKSSEEKKNQQTVSADSTQPETKPEPKTFAELSEQIAVETLFYKNLYSLKGIEPTGIALEFAKYSWAAKSVFYKLNDDPFDPTRARKLYERYHKRAIELGATPDELPSETSIPFYDLIQLGKWCENKAKEAQALASGQKKEEKIVLTQHQQKILKYLNKINTAVAQVDIESQTGLSNKTVSTELSVLKGYNYVAPPKGKTRRIVITQRGVDSLT